MLDYHIEIRVISHDLESLALFSWEIPRITYHKFITAISNQQFSRHEYRTEAWQNGERMPSSGENGTWATTRALIG